MSETSFTFVQYDESESSISITDDGKIIGFAVNDIFGDNAVIHLPEPQRSKLIEKIAGLKYEA